jgi:hypothetical protein
LTVNRTFPRQLLHTSALLLLSLSAFAQPTPDDTAKYGGLLDPSPKVREETLFSSKPRIPFDVLERFAVQLAGDSSYHVRRRIGSVSRNPAVLSKLADDPHEQVRSAVARNVAAPASVLNAMAKKLADTPEESTSGMNKRESFAAFSLMANPNLPPQAFVSIARFFPITYRMEEHRNLPLDIFLKYQMADDPWGKGTPEYNDMQRAKALLGKPAEMLTAMAKSERSDFIQMAGMNAQTPPDVLTAILDRSKKEDWYTLAEAIAANAQLASDHPAITKLLPRLEKHKNEEVRAALYANPNAPVEVLRRGANAKQEDDRETARLTLWLAHGIAIP